MNGVRFVISKREEVPLGPASRLDHSRTFVWQNFIKVRKWTEEVSDIGIRRGTESAPLLVISRPYILLPDPLPQHASSINKIGTSNRKVSLDPL